ncbi:armadillo-type protein [Nemania sp. FL0916]|nr:armadillo-type protein [Nemania sp. FL0916]
MSAVRSTGSPTLRRTLAPRPVKMDENIKAGMEDVSVAAVGDQLKSLLNFDSDDTHLQKRSTGALSASSLVNQSCPEKPKQSHESIGASEMPEPSPDLPASFGLAQQSSGFLPNRNTPNYAAEATNFSQPERTATSNSVPIMPATETFGNTGPATRPASAAMNGSSATNNEEVLRLKLELAHAQNRITHLDQELASTRQGHVGPDHPINPSPVNTEFAGPTQSAPTASRVPGLHPINTTAQYLGREAGHSWSGYEDNQSDTSEALSATGFNRSRDIWGGMKSAPCAPGPNGHPPHQMPQNGMWNGRPASHSYTESNMTYGPTPAGTFRPERLTPDFDLTAKPLGSRRSSRYDTRFGDHNFAGAGQGYAEYSYSQGQYDPVIPSAGGSQNNMGPGLYTGRLPTPIGTPLSPLASEFTSMSGSAEPWKSEPGPSEGQTYLPTTEPLNYRRLLDRNVNCNWKYIVDKIVCSNDQQASIFLQQKLKVGTPDQKYDIVEAIVSQAYPLMVNRFGNFLVQRCFEHGTPEQVIKIAEAIRGCTLTLSMDPFGCHVVQKAFDSVPEDYKAIMVHELLRRIPETVIHRYACHVWQKLFELRWTKSPPQIMKYVNEALRGMWHEVALGETGSLVVQNIFENCLEEDKRPCIEEVLSNIDIVAHGQFGNWCIQHICEHGAPADRSRAIDHVIRFAAEYSMDQYASKVVEKCLKIGNGEFLARYLDRVCEGRIDRPRIPLIDIASDQYGNYLIQWILQHANPQHKEIVAAHIRKHMVSLRGSKFGSRVGMLCTNPAIATRPGPGLGPGTRMPPGPRYVSRFQ